jgi:hypothetical protein
MRSGSHPEPQDDAGDGLRDPRHVVDPHPLVRGVGELEPRDREPVRDAPGLPPEDELAGAATPAR